MACQFMEGDVQICVRSRTSHVVNIGMKTCGTESIYIYYPMPADTRVAMRPGVAHHL